MSENNDKFTLRRGLLDFQAGESISEVRMDIKEYISTSATAGVQTLAFMAKDAYGNSYYNTKIGHKNSRIQGDFLEEALREAKKANIEIYAYYNVGLNSHVAHANPDYYQRDKDGNPINRAYEYYDMLCMNSPYREYVMEQLIEIARGYDVKGFFLDITYIWPTACYCQYCQRSYRQRFGSPIHFDPQPGTREMIQWLQFKREIRLNFLRDTVNTIKTVNPDLCISWNGSASHAMAHVEADEYADFLTSEMHPPSYLDAGIKSKWARTIGKPFELSLPFEMGSWGDWTLAPSSSLRAIASTAVSNGASVNINNVPYPSGKYAGKVNDCIVKAIGDIYGWIERVEPWLLDAESVPNIAVLYGIDNKRMLDASGFNDSPANHAYLNGINRILTEGSVHFDIISENILENGLDKYKLLILPDQAYISESNQKIIRDYIKGGGCLLASGRTSLYRCDCIRKDNFGMADVFGVDFCDISPYSVGYIHDIKEICSNLPDMPLLIKEGEAPVLRVAGKRNVSVLAYFIDPALEANKNRHVYHQHAHPARSTGYPAVVYSKYGEGHCIYIPCSIESSFWNTGSPWLRDLYLNCISKLMPDPIISISAPKSVDVSLMRQDSRWILHLVNIREEKASGSRCFIEDIVPVRDIKVRGRVLPDRVYIAPDMKEVKFFRIDGGVEFTIPEVGLHSIVVLEGVE